MKNYLYSLFFFLLLLSPLSAEQKVAILGDSITYAGGWPATVEASLKNTPAFKEATIVNFGLPSENVSGLSEKGHAGGAFPRPCVFERLNRILDKFKPTLVIACYGMNDGIMQPLDESRFDAFRKGMNKLKTDVEKTGASFIVITPPLFEGDKTDKSPGNYDEVLDAYSQWLVAQKEKGWQVIDIRPSLRKSIAEEKKQTPAFIFAGDGVHPGAKGHNFIAQTIIPELAAILKCELVLKTPENGERTLSDWQKLAWLTETGHKRPGIPQGFPVSYVSKPNKATSLSEWHGFIKHDFIVPETKLAGMLVVPLSPAKGNPWIWRTEFFGHEPQADIALLKKGFHVAYAKVNDMYGSPQSIKLMKSFYDYVEKNYKLAPKVILEGFSRGGLYAYNWAAAYPDKVVGLYVDAPVCDFKSWPGGKGKSKPQQKEWQELLKCYELTEEQALQYKKNPIDNLKPLAKAGIPILAVVGDVDDVVPVEENTAIVEKRYRALGGKIEVIHKENVNHHPHSLMEPSRIVDFALSCYKLPVPRRITCIGDSITEGSGCGSQKRWSTVLGEMLGSNYEVTNLGISARTLMDAGDHPFRKENNYKKALQMKPEYFFIALGTNDSKPHNWKNKEDFEKTYVSMIAELRKNNPKVKIFCLQAIPAYPENHGIADKIIQGEVNPMIAKIAKANKCTLVDLYTPMIGKGHLVPDKVHPGAEGHAIMAKVLYEALGNK